MRWSSSWCWWWSSQTRRWRCLLQVFSFLSCSPGGRGDVHRHTHVPVASTTGRKWSRKAKLAFHTHTQRKKEKKGRSILAICIILHPLGCCSFLVFFFFVCFVFLFVCLFFGCCTSRVGGIGFCFSGHHFSLLERSTVSEKKKKR